MFQNFRKASARFGFCQPKMPLPRDPKVPPDYSAGLQIYRVEIRDHIYGAASLFQTWVPWLVCTENLSSGVVVVKSAKDGM
jgi:hypothetical protein